MSTEGKVLEFPKLNNSQKDSKADKKASIVDIVGKRQEIIQDERRSVRRTILTEFIGVHTVVPGYGLQKCTLRDISVKGIAFDLEKKQGRFKPGEEVAMRVYLNHKTYFPFVISIRSSRFISDEGVYRHGGLMLEDTVNKEALEHFMNFIETVSTHLKTDHGDVIVSNLNQP